MSSAEIPGSDPELQTLIDQSIENYSSYITPSQPGWLLVDTARQRLVWVRGDRPAKQWPVSTSSVGLDNRQDSGGTPPGLHRIADKIGTDAPAGAIFVSRRDTGQVWDRANDTTAEDLILTRVLTLEGCEPGLNQGPGIDSQARYIYLHGTNDEAHIGQPVSHGCVRLTNADIQTVFDLVSEGDPVVIV